MKTQLTHPILQYPTDLVFAVMEADVSHLLTVLKTETVNVGDYTIRFAIIGESHCITVLHQKQLILQEVLACTDIPVILQANSHKFAKLDMHHHIETDYQAHIWFADELIKADWDDQGVIKMDFPEMFGQVPFTQVTWQVSRSDIQWRTTHVYPLKTHTTYVYTESKFDLTGRSNNE